MLNNERIDVSTRDLINAIESGDAIAVENAFNAAMAEKISTRIDDMRVEVAKNMFNEKQTEDTNTEN